MPVPSLAALQMIGCSRAIEAIDAEIGCAAPSQARVLITGEAGTGKGLIARLIHQRGPRASAPFTVVNCGAVVGAELTTWLCGQTGTVLLDGATEMPRPIQDRL